MPVDDAAHEAIVVAELLVASGNEVAVVGMVGAADRDG